jgi:predicted acetyltransferase
MYIVEIYGYEFSEIVLLTEDYDRALIIAKKVKKSIGDLDIKNTWVCIKEMDQEYIYNFNFNDQYGDYKRPKTIWTCRNGEK